MPDGYRINEIANDLGVSPSWVSARLDELRTEILLSAGRFLPLTDTEYQTLKDSIAEHGQQVPIIVGATGFDGLHRLHILRELGIDEVKAEFLVGYSPEQEREIFVTVNAARRHITRAQKEALVRAELERGWDRSSRHIGAICGVNHETVEAVRDKVRSERAAAAGHTVAKPATPIAPATVVPPPLPAKEHETRLDRSGRRQPAYVERGTPPRNAPDSPTVVGTAACDHGLVHTIRRHSDGSYTLEPA